MNAQERGDRVLKSLANGAAREKWSRDPVSYMQDAGFSGDLPGAIRAHALTEDGKARLRAYLSSLDLEVDGGSGRLLGSGWWACTGCKVGIGATVFAITAVIVAACIAAVAATDGAAAPAEAAASEMIEAGTVTAEVAAVSAETGLTAARVAKIFVTAFLAYGAASFAEEAIEALCKATGACAA